MSKSYLIRDIDDETWKDFKTACVYYDISMRATLIKHIQNIVNDYRKARMMFDKPKIYKDEKGKR